MHSCKYPHKKKLEVLWIKNYLKSEKKSKIYLVKLSQNNMCKLSLSTLSPLHTSNIKEKIYIIGPK